MTDKPAPVYILFHGNCFDGTGAKYAAWKKYHNYAKYFPVKYGENPPDMEPGSEVYILDFSYSREVLDALRAAHKSVVILDHHKTAEEALRGYPGATFDMNTSGAVLAWNYFHPDKPVPDLLLHVQDRDLWKFDLKGTEEIMSGVPLLKSDMKNWDKVAGSYKRLENLRSNGAAIQMLNEMKIDSVVDTKTIVINYHGFRAGITNSTELSSEIGNRMCRSEKLKVDIGIVYFITPELDVLFSLRSLKEGSNVDVSEIAKSYGGGGHRNASGYRMSLEHLQEIIKNGK